MFPCHRRDMEAVLTDMRNKGVTEHSQVGMAFPSEYTSYVDATCRGICLCASFHLSVRDEWSRRRVGGGVRVRTMRGRHTV